MSSDRIRYALASGGLVLPDGAVALVGAPGDADLAPLMQATVINGFAPDVMAWEARGVTVLTALSEDLDTVIVTLPRARDLAEDRIARAAAKAKALVVVDGAKTDGVESLIKAVKARVPVLGQVSKAHGKCFWFAPTDALSDWQRPDRSRNAAGFWTAPGVFSAGGPDPASEALASALPASLKGAVADLGAGWGWLSAQLMVRDAITALHLVEADHAALACSRANVTDPRAVFHWAEVTRWSPPVKLDAVVMNPPFHAGRRADPALGRAFITAAADMLAPHGRLWMVANRHLPYETTLTERFRTVEEIGGDSRFKLLHATRPQRPPRARR